MKDKAPKEQPPLEYLQRALTISAFDLEHNGGRMTFQGCAELSDEEIFRSQLPPPKPSSTRLLILEAPFSIDKPGVRQAMPDWFNQLDKQEPRPEFNLWDLENLWAEQGRHDSSQTFRTNDFLVAERATKPSEESIQETLYLRAGYMDMGPLKSSRIHFWQYSASASTSYTKNGAIQLICRFPLIPEHYKMSVYYDEQSVEVFADPNTTMVSPLKREFLKRLLSEESATRSCSQDTDISYDSHHGFCDGVRPLPY